MFNSYNLFLLGFGGGNGVLLFWGGSKFSGSLLAVVSGEYNRSVDSIRPVTDRNWSADLAGNGCEWFLSRSQ